MNTGLAEPKRFQLTLFGILVSALWSAVFVCGLMLCHELVNHRLVPSHGEGAAYLAVSLLLSVSLRAAIDGLLGRATRGIAVGILLLFLFLIALRIAEGI